MHYQILTTDCQMRASAGAERRGEMHMQSRLLACWLGGRFFFSAARKDGKRACKMKYVLRSAFLCGCRACMGNAEAQAVSQQQLTELSAMKKRHFHFIESPTKASCRLSLWLSLKGKVFALQTIASSASQAALHLLRRPVVEGVSQSVHPEVTQRLYPSIACCSSGTRFCLACLPALFAQHASAV